jgi:hypothetical protein
MTNDKDAPPGNLFVSASRALLRHPTNLDPPNLDARRPRSVNGEDHNDPRTLGT